MEPEFERAEADVARAPRAEKKSLKSLTILTGSNFACLHLIRSANATETLEISCHVFTSGEEFSYFPFCDDFGPMNLGQAFKFIDVIEEKKSTFPNHKLLYYCEQDQRSMTNAVFLLGSYLMIARQLTQAWPDKRDAGFVFPTKLDCATRACGGGGV